MKKVSFIVLLLYASYGYAAPKKKRKQIQKKDSLSVVLSESKRANYELEVPRQITTMSYNKSDGEEPFIGLAREISDQDKRDWKIWVCLNCVYLTAIGTACCKLCIDSLTEKCD